MSCSHYILSRTFTPTTTHAFIALTLTHSNTTHELKLIPTRSLTSLPHSFSHSVTLHHSLTYYRARAHTHPLTDLLSFFHSYAYHRLFLLVAVWTLPSLCMPIICPVSIFTLSHSTAHNETRGPAQHDLTIVSYHRMHKLNSEQSRPILFPCLPLKMSWTNANTKDCFSICILMAFYTGNISDSELRGHLRRTRRSHVHIL